MLISSISLYIQFKSKYTFKLDRIPFLDHESIHATSEKSCILKKKKNDITLTFIKIAEFKCMITAG